MQCKHFKIRNRKQKKYFYCALLKKEIEFSNCKYCREKDFKVYKMIKDVQIPIKKVSKAQSKLNNNRSSVFTSELDKCVVCGFKIGCMDIHEIFEGKLRKRSIEYNFCIPLCRSCHIKIHKDNELAYYWKKKGKDYFIENFGNEEDFYKVFPTKKV